MHQKRKGYLKRVPAFYTNLHFVLDFYNYIIIIQYERLCI